MYGFYACSFKQIFVTLSLNINNFPTKHNKCSKYIQHNKQYLIFHNL